MLTLTPLAQVPGFDETLRKKLAEYWITSAEEFSSAVRSSNKTHGSGLKALALALGVPEDTIRSLSAAVRAVLPSDTPFNQFIELEVGAGLIIDGLPTPDAASFATVVELPAAVPSLASAKKLHEPANQGKRNSCVAFSLAALFQIMSGDPTDLSEQFFYYICKEKDGIAGDTGTNPLLAMQLLQSTGICREQTWPYKPEPVDNAQPGHARPSDAAFQEAKQRRISSFTQLPAAGTAGVLQIKQALSQGKPVMIGMPIYEHWTGSAQARILGRLRAPLPGEGKSGGHAMCVVGYQDEVGAPGGGYFIVRNSWGTNWGTENVDGPGYCHIPYRLVASQNLVAFTIDGITPFKAETTNTTVGAAPAALPTKQALMAQAQDIQQRLNALVAGINSLPGSLGSAPTVGGAFDEVPPIVSQQQLQPESAATLYAQIRLLVDRLGEVLSNTQVAPALTPSAAAEAVLEPAPAAEAIPADIPAYQGPLILLSQSSDGGERLYPNGIDGSTGMPLLQIDEKTASDIAYADQQHDEQSLRGTYDAKLAQAKGGHYGVVAGVSEGLLEESRWAVVIPAHEDTKVLKALWPLIRHRMQQMGFSKLDFDFREGETCSAWVYRHSDNGKKNLANAWGSIPPVLFVGDNEGVNRWLARHGVAQAPVDPTRGVPYYLMLVGRPGPLNAQDKSFIPLEFQYELDIFWGVGRVLFTDQTGQHRLADYTTYAERVVQFETRADAAERLRKELAFFGTKHEEDTATIRSADELIAPLAEWSKKSNLAKRQGYGQQIYLAEEATRTNLEKLLNGGSDGKAPAIMLTASHGIGLPLSDERLVMHQGSLVTQDWTGFGGIKRDHWVAGEDLGANTKVEGMMAFIFACYGAGCPQNDEFIFDANRKRPQIAPFDFISQLPQKLLLNGALAVLGHVERAWTYSFSGTEVGVTSQTQPFQDVIGRLMEGRRAGSATDQFNVVQSARAMTLSKELEQVLVWKATPDPALLSRLWMARNDARNYALLGDPAVKLPFAIVPTPA